MKKLWITMLTVIILTLGITLGIAVYKGNISNRGIATKNETKIEEISEAVTDECIDEYEQIENEEIEANSNEEKISPNCKLTLKKYYTECEHTINEYLDITKNLINKTQKELEEEYSDWEVEKYSSTDIILYKKFESNCGQHFVLRNTEGKIVIYLINDNNQEEVYEKTEISVEYLPETDKIEIGNGIKVFGKENLNQMLENFE